MHCARHSGVALSMEAGMNALTTLPVRTIDIVRDQQVGFDATRGCIQLVHGSAWLTQVGRIEDIFLAAGEQWPLAGRSVVVSALAPARLRLVGGGGLEGSFVARCWRGALRAARRTVQRLQFGPMDSPPWA
jgi:hypothetical protein